MSMLVKKSAKVFFNIAIIGNQGIQIKPRRKIIMIIIAIIIIIILVVLKIIIIITYYIIITSELKYAKLMERRLKKLSFLR